MAATKKTDSPSPPPATSTKSNTDRSASDSGRATPIGIVQQTSTSQPRYEDYQIMPQSPWPPPVFVKKEVTPQERYYLEHRWNSQWQFFDKKATENKNRYFNLQRIIVIGSVTVPVLVSFNATILESLLPFAFGAGRAPAGTVIDFTTVVLSLAVAIAAGMEGLNKYGELWSSYRQAAEELQAEKSFYDVGAGRYANNPDAFSRFVERCEEIIAQQHGRFIASVEKQIQEADKRDDEILGLVEENGEDTQPAPAIAETSAG